MALVNTAEFPIVGIIMGAVFVFGIIYFIKLINDNSARTRIQSHTRGGGRRKRPRQMKKKRR